MKITPIDITHRTFQKKLFGIDESEVTEFLQQISAQLEAVIHERNALKEQLREKEIYLNEYKERDGLLKSTIATASQMADRLRQDVEREAKLIIADAQQKAEIIQRDARDSLKKIYQELSELRKMKLQFEAHLRALAQAHLTLLEQGDKFIPNIGLPHHSLEGSGASQANMSTSTQAPIGNANPN